MRGILMVKWLCLLLNKPSKKTCILNNKAWISVKVEREVWGTWNSAHRAEKQGQEWLLPGTAKSITEAEGKGVRQKLRLIDWKTLNANLRNLDFTEDCVIKDHYEHRGIIRAVLQECEWCPIYFKAQEISSKFKCLLFVL